MAYSVDYSGDYQFVDGIETLSMVVSGAAARTVSGFRTTVSNPIGGVGGGYQPEPTLTVFYVYNDGGREPDVGDSITDAALDKWMVTLVTQQSDGSQWGLTCVLAT